MATGVPVADEVVEQFNGFKLQREGFQHRFFVYKIDNDEINIESTGARDATYEDFVAALPEDDCRYGLIDLEFQTHDGRPTSKIVFIAWSPDTARVRSKMVYAGSKEAIKRVFVGVGIHITATDQSELSLEESVLPVVKKFT